MVALAYTETRRNIAHSSGLGRKKAVETVAKAAPKAKASAKPRGRPAKAKPKEAATAE